MKAMSQRPWMKESGRPELKDWLGPKFSQQDRERIAGCGNVVIPLMAFFAVILLQRSLLSEADYI